MKKIISIIAANKTKVLAYSVLAIIIFFFFIWREANAVPLVVHTINEKDTSLEISVEYPQFKYVAGGFNKGIKDVVDKEIADFKKGVVGVNTEDNDEKDKSVQNSIYTLKVWWTPATISPGVISFVLHSAYFTGGVHGGRNLYTFNFDTKTKKNISLDDMFGSVPNYLARISGYAINDLKNQPLLSSVNGKLDQAALERGTAPTLDNYSHFTVGHGNEIIFYFPESQVAPYSLGEQQVVMPIPYILSSGPTS